MTSEAPRAARAKRAFIRWSRRLLPLAFLGCAVLWMSEFWPGRTQEAHGLVYESSMRGVAQVARYLSGLANTGETRLGRFNNNRMYYRVCTSRDTIKQIFDHYTNTYRLRPEPKLGVSELLPPGVDAKTMKRLEAIDEQLRQMDNVYRWEADEMGILGVLDLGPNWQTELFQRAKRFSETGLIDDLGKAKMITAFRPKKARRTTFITFWPGPGFDINNLVPPPDGEDAPGRDLKDMPRCPGLVRTAAAEELASFARGYVGVYESNGPLTGVPQFYASNMPTKGWTRQGLPTDQPVPVENAQALFFSKAGKECLVLIRNTGRDGVVQVIVTCRWPSRR